MKLRVYASRLQFNHTFHIAAGARDFTDVVYVEVSSDGKTGYGEAALPPYLAENTTSVLNYLSKINLPANYDGNFFGLLDALHGKSEKNYPALAALDIALHDLQGKILNITSRSIHNITNEMVPDCAFTIGMCSEMEMKAKMAEAAEFRFFKLKLGGGNDRFLVESFRNLTDLPFCVDVNRGWKKLDAAIETSLWLAKQGCVFIEQPFEKHMLNETNELRQYISIPVILDESVQTIDDVLVVKNHCDGINIKLVKCGGIYPAYKMINDARKLGLKIFIGCMSESSCGIAGAAQLAPLADWVDLDGPLLISNDPFKGVIYNNGKIVLSDKPGIGVERNAEFRM